MLQTNQIHGTLWQSAASTKERVMATLEERDQLQRDASKWFIERFILSKYGKQFLLRREGFEPIPSEIEFTRQRKRFPEYGFQFLALDNQVIIKPFNIEAQWAEGVIYRDENGFHYWSGEVGLQAITKLPT